MRDDYLASICIVNERNVGATVTLLAELETTLSKNFRYFEIIYVLAESMRDQLNDLVDLIERMPNLRILLTDDNISFYQQRAIAAAEAIGDVVALVDLADLHDVGIVEQIHEAKVRNLVLIGWRGSRRAGGLAYRALSLLSRHSITANASRTIILSRDRLNAILARERASLDLRFEPRGGQVRYIPFELTGKAGSSTRLAHRYELLTEVLRTGAPRYLKIYAVTGFAVALAAALYGAYAIGVVLTRDHVQEGWFSTAFILAGAMGFISMGMSILAIALAAVLESATGNSDRVILDEMSNISFFDQLTDRNVEIDTGDMPKNAKSTADGG